MRVAAQLIFTLAAVAATGEEMSSREFLKQWIQDKNVIDKALDDVCSPEADRLTLQRLHQQTGPLWLFVIEGREYEMHDYGASFNAQQSTIDGVIEVMESLYDAGVVGKEFRFSSLCKSRR